MIIIDLPHMPSMSNPISLDDPLGLDPYPQCGQTPDDAMCRAVFFKPNPSCKTTFKQCLDSCVSTLNSQAGVRSFIITFDFYVIPNVFEKYDNNRPDPICAAMMKLISVGCFLILLAGAGFILKGSSSPAAGCTTEEIYRVTSPDGNIAATYENAICTENPSLLEMRVFLSLTHATSQVSADQIFVAYSPIISKRGERPTQGKKLDIKWLDAKTLAVNNSPELEIIRSSIPPDDIPIRFFVNNRQVLSTEKIAKLVEGEQNDLKVLHTYLKFMNDERIQNDAFALMYKNFGKPEFLPTIDALWSVTEANYPQFDWKTLRSITTRLRLAALWGQWHREFLGEAVAAEKAAAFAREYLDSKTPEIRLQAISSLGTVGSFEDRKMLADIVLGSDQQAALKATSSIFSIERKARISDSILPSLAAKATAPEIRSRISEYLELLKKGV